MKSQKIIFVFLLAIGASNCAMDNQGSEQDTRIAVEITASTNNLQPEDRFRSDLVYAKPRQIDMSKPGAFARTKCPCPPRQHALTQKILRNYNVSHVPQVVINDEQPDISPRTIQALGIFALHVDITVDSDGNPLTPKDFNGELKLPVFKSPSFKKAAEIVNAPLTLPSTASSQELAEYWLNRFNS